MTQISELNVTLRNLHFIWSDDARLLIRLGKWNPHEKLDKVMTPISELNVTLTNLPFIWSDDVWLLIRLGKWNPHEKLDKVMTQILQLSATLRNLQFIWSDDVWLLIRFIKMEPTLAVRQSGDSNVRVECNSYKSTVHMIWWCPTPNTFRKMEPTFRS